MKKIGTIILYFLIGIVAFCQNFSLDGIYPFQEDSLLSMMTIQDGKVILKYENPPINNLDQEISYKIEKEYGLSFIVLSENMPKEVANWKDYEDNDFIETNNKILFLAFQNKNKQMFAFTAGYSQKTRPLTFTRFDEWGSLYKDCSSFLIEKTMSYPVDNLRRLTVETPWVEDANGNGIGEGFTIICNTKKPLGPYLFLINGYISYEKPYLYKQNNRIKKIKVTGLKSGNSAILDILDTPHPQTVDISFITEPEDIRIEIADVYKGTKYDDTCLHFCITYDNMVIPYEDCIPE